MSEAPEILAAAQAGTTATVAALLGGYPQPGQPLTIQAIAHSVEGGDVVASWMVRAILLERGLLGIKDGQTVVQTISRPQLDDIICVVDELCSLAYESLDGERIDRVNRIDHSDLSKSAATQAARRDVARECQMPFLRWLLGPLLDLLDLGLEQNQPATAGAPA